MTTVEENAPKGEKKEGTHIKKIGKNPILFDFFVIKNRLK